MYVVCLTGYVFNILCVSLQNFIQKRYISELNFNGLRLSWNDQMNKKNKTKKHTEKRKTSKSKKFVQFILILNLSFQLPRLTQFLAIVLSIFEGMGKEKNRQVYHVMLEDIYKNVFDSKKVFSWRRNFE